MSKLEHKELSYITWATSKLRDPEPLVSSWLFPCCLNMNGLPSLPKPYAKETSHKEEARLSLCPEESDST